MQGHSSSNRKEPPFYLFFLEFSTPLVTILSSELNNLIQIKNRNCSSSIKFVSPIDFHFSLNFRKNSDTKNCFGDELNCVNVDASTQIHDDKKIPRACLHVISHTLYTRNISYTKRKFPIEALTCKAFVC